VEVLNSGIGESIGVLSDKLLVSPDVMAFCVK
jgi:hypothetical protein